MDITASGVTDNNFDPHSDITGKSGTQFHIFIDSLTAAWIEQPPDLVSYSDEFLCIFWYLYIMYIILAINIPRWGRGINIQMDRSMIEQISQIKFDEYN